MDMLESVYVFEDVWDIGTLGHWMRGVSIARWPGAMGTWCELPMADCTSLRVAAKGRSRLRIFSSHTGEDAEYCAADYEPGQYFLYGRNESILALTPYQALR
jgi:hypothetical protein